MNYEKEKRIAVNKYMKVKAKSVYLCDVCFSRDIFNTRYDENMIFKTKDELKKHIEKHETDNIYKGINLK